MTKTEERRGGFKKPRDVRELRSTTMSDEEQIRQIRTRILRLALESVLSAPMSNAEWRVMMRHVYLEGKNRSEKGGQDEESSS